MQPSTPGNVAPAWGSAWTPEALEAWIATSMRHGPIAFARAIVQAASRHTGLPALLVAAVLLVAGYRLGRHAKGFLVELAVAVTVLFLAARAGWIRW